MKKATKASQAAAAETQDLELVLSDAVSMADEAMGQALDFCARKMGLDAREAALGRLRDGDRTACSYFHYSLAGQAAEWLGAWDESIKAVYIYDCDATPEDLCLGESTGPSLLHLIVWARRKTSALNAILQVLDRALVQCYADMTGARGLKHLLDGQVVDDGAVRDNVGCGALLCSLHTRPIRIWER